MGRDSTHKIQKLNPRQTTYTTPCKAARSMIFQLYFIWVIFWDFFFKLTRLLIFWHNSQNSFSKKCNPFHIFGLLFCDPFGIFHYSFKKALLHEFLQIFPSNYPFPLINSFQLILFNPFLLNNSYFFKLSYHSKAYGFKKTFKCKLNGDRLWFDHTKTMFQEQTHLSH